MQVLMSQSPVPSHTCCCSMHQHVWQHARLVWLHAIQVHVLSCGTGCNAFAMCWCTMPDRAQRMSAFLVCCSSVMGAVWC